MLLESVQVKRYRSILDETLTLDDLTTLLGANGSGKSAFLRALDLFYSPSPKIDIEDFYGNDSTKEIVVSVTFNTLNPRAAELFSKYVQDGRLTVEKVFSSGSGKIISSYHGSALRNPEFAEIRAGLEIKDRGATAKKLYSELPPEYGLPAWTTLAAVEPNLQAWEEANHSKCKPSRDDGRFFGFTGVGEGHLGKFSRFLFIPAVRDASSDATEGKGSALTDLMDMVVRSVIAQKTEVKALRESTQQRYEELLNPQNLQELGNLSTVLTGTLQTYVPTASVHLSWLPLDQIEIRMPRADIKLVEDNFGTAVHRTGHGLQRAFILTMLQHLALAHSKASAEVSAESDTEIDDSHLPNLLLAIEEPELFQHPSRQRHFARILSQLASGATPGVAAKTQVLCATHSPLFVGLDRFSNLRIIRKIQAEDGAPGISKVVSSSLQAIADQLWNADGNSGQGGDEFSGEVLLHRLRAIMTPQINEGFFANAVVLVEGEDDFAALTAVAKQKGVDLDALGVALIPVGGKRNLDRPALIFRGFGIPVYLVWDADAGQGETKGKCASCGRPLDKKSDPKDNHRLLRIIKQEVSDWPSGVGHDYCCFASNLETTLSTELGSDLFDALLLECQEEFGIPKRRHAIKNPNVISEVLSKASASGARCNTIDQAVDRIVAMVTG